MSWGAGKRKPYALLFSQVTWETAAFIRVEYYVGCFPHIGLCVALRILVFTYNGFVLVVCNNDFVLVYINSFNKIFLSFFLIKNFTD